MEENLINAVKNYEFLYNKNLLLYRNKKKRAAAWNAISRELNLPEEVCQSRWKSLRDKFVKKVSESHRASGRGADMGKAQWQYHEPLEFLREHVQLRRTVTSVTPAYENCFKVSPTSPLEDGRHQNIDSFEDVKRFEYFEEQPTGCTTMSSDSNSLPLEVTSRSRKRARRESHSEAFAEFLKKVTAIIENRFSGSSAPEENSTHSGFFAMVREIFDDLPSEKVRDAKFFFLSYLRDQVVIKKET